MTMKSAVPVLFLVGTTLVSVCHGFAVAAPKLSASCFVSAMQTSPLALKMSTGVNQDESDTVTTIRGGLLKRDRYVATNRFAVRKDKAAKFEQRWATRKSRLAMLPGFKYFHLMRRVTLEDDGTCTYDEGSDEKTSAGNYVSFTIWEKKSDFSAWRTGDAFKEAHGGTSIGAFLSTMVNSAFILRGPPRPAFYDGLLVQSIPPATVPETVDGWRSVQADGITTLPAECFVACNQFYVPSENAAAFEQQWADRTSTLQEYDGFVAFTMMRRDGSAKGHGTSPMSSDEPTYASTTIWKNRVAFDNWKADFGKGHGGKKEGGATPAPPLWSKPPSPVFYEGTLVITGKDGA